MIFFGILDSGVATVRSSPGKIGSGHVSMNERSVLRSLGTAGSAGDKAKSAGLMKRGGSGVGRRVCEASCGGGRGGTFGGGGRTAGGRGSGGSCGAACGGG
jgi:hypothetical protein